MSFEEQITEKLSAKKLSAPSIKLYISNLRKLNEGLPIKNFRFLANVDETMKKLESLKPNTRKSILSSIVSIMNCFLLTPAITNLCNKYYKLMNHEKSIIKETPTTVLSATQKANWIDWADIMKIWKQLYDATVTIAKKKTISELQYNITLNFMVLSLFTKIPPRRNLDWSAMYFKNPLKQDNLEYNYIDLENNEFTFNQYKTKNKYKQYKMAIPPELRECIDLYIKHHPMIKIYNKKNNKIDVPFLVYFNEKPLTAINAITRILNNLFKKKVGSSMIRHIFLTNAYGKEDAERKIISEQMGHSAQTQRDYIKQPPKDIVIDFD